VKNRLDVDRVFLLIERKMDHEWKSFEGEGSGYLNSGFDKTGFWPGILVVNSKLFQICSQGQVLVHHNNQLHLEHPEGPEAL